MGKTVKKIVENRRVPRDYEILKLIEAGICLLGPEVKSVRAKRVSIKDSYADIKNNEVYLYNMHIDPYKMAGKILQDPTRPRKLLLTKREIKYLIGKIKERGLTLVPTKVYLRGAWVKVELALARGKKKYEKREAIKKRIIEREIQRALKKELR